MLLGLTRGFDMTFQQYKQCSRNALVRLEQCNDPLGAMQPSHHYFFVVTDVQKNISLSKQGQQSSSSVPTSIRI